jgi:hypothetical protein
MKDKNERSPAWTVLGQPKENSEQVYWAAYFEDKKAYWEEHKAAQEPSKGRFNVVKEFMESALHTDFKANMAGSHMG